MQSKLLPPVKKRKPKKLLLVAFLVLCVVVALLALNNFANKDDKPTPTPTQDSTNLAPATEEDIKEVEDTKDKLDPSVSDNDASTPTPTTANTKKQVTPIITSANSAGNQISVRSFIPTVIEDGGTCNIKLSAKGSTNTVTSAESSAFSTGTSTSCEEVKLTAVTGAYDVYVTYTSQYSNGTSTAFEVEVQ